MANKTRTQTAAKPATRTASDRKPVTLEMAVALCPNANLAENLSRTFGLDPVDTAGIREATEEHVASGRPSSPRLSPRRLWKCTCSGSSAPMSVPPSGPASSIPQKVTQARDLTAKIANDAAMRTVTVWSGFESRAGRAPHLRR